MDWQYLWSMLRRGRVNALRQCIFAPDGKVYGNVNELSPDLGRLSGLPFGRSVLHLLAMCEPPPHVACGSIHDLSALLRELVDEYGADINCIGSNGTPLHDACHVANGVLSEGANWHRGIVEALLDSGAHVDGPIDIPKTPLANVIGPPILQHRTECKAACVALLLDRGADPKRAEVTVGQLPSWVDDLVKSVPARWAARKATITLIGIKRCRRSPVIGPHNPMDIILGIARDVWRQRDDPEWDHTPK